MRETSVNWTAPADTIGWCAVILPDADQYQGFYILRTDEAKAVAKDLVAVAWAISETKEAAALGALQAVLVEGSMTGREDLVGGAALALVDALARPYFVIVAHAEAAGIRTEMLPLDANDTQSARDAFEGLPVVGEIKQRIAVAAPTKKH